MKNIKLKQTGQNLSVTINDQLLTKRIEDKEIREGIKADVEKYNAKNDAKIEKKLLTLFTVKKVEKATKKEEAKVAVEKVKTAEKKVKEVKEKTVADVVKTVADSKPKVTQSDVDRLKQQLADAEKQLAESKGIVIPVETTPSPRRGEYK